LGTEIERKFLVSPGWRPGGEGMAIVQGYLSSAKERLVRIRLIGDEARITIKGAADGISRAEYEYPIPVEDAREILATLCERPFVDKTRYLVPYAGMAWEVDVFHGDNEGLVIAELELPRADAAFDPPPWLAGEVSGDERYGNSRLARHPWRSWALPAAGDGTYS